MTSSFVLTLDTTAPQVTWGAVGGAEAGQLLQVAYTLDEPDAVSAEFVSFAGEHVPLTVLPDRVEGLLPPAITGGLGSVLLTVLDDLGNEAVRELKIQVVSPVGGVPARTGPGIVPTAAPGPRLPQEVIVRSRLPVLSGTVAVAAVAVSSDSRQTSRTSVERSFPTPLVRLTRSQLRAPAGAAAVVRIPARSQLRVAGGGRVLRRDGQDEEALLLALVD